MEHRTGTILETYDGSAGHEQRLTAEMSQYMEGLANAPEWQDLTESFGTRMPVDFTQATTTEKLRWLKMFSAKHLDNRAEGDRQSAPSVTYNPAQTEAIKEFKRAFRLEGESQASQSEYDNAIVFGAMADERTVAADGTETWKDGSMTLRLRKLQREMDRGVEVENIFLPSSARKLKPTEVAANDGCVTEYDAMVRAFERESGITDETPGVVVTEYEDQAHDPTSPDYWKIRRYQLDDGQQAFALHAPAVENRRKGVANTADILRFTLWVAEQFGVPTEDASVLGVTADLYVHFQHVDALTQLSLKGGMDVETIGYGGVYRPDDKYTQEMNSMIRRTVRLAAELDPKSYPDVPQEKKPGFLRTAEYAIARRADRTLDLRMDKRRDIGRQALGA